MHVNSLTSNLSQLRKDIECDRQRRLNRIKASGRPLAKLTSMDYTMLAQQLMNALHEATRAHISSDTQAIDLYAISDGFLCLVLDGDQFYMQLKPTTMGGRVIIMQDVDVLHMPIDTKLEFDYMSELFELIREKLYRTPSLSESVTL